MALLVLYAHTGSHTIMRRHVLIGLEVWYVTSQDYKNKYLLETSEAKTGASGAVIFGINKNSRYALFGRIPLIYCL